MSGIQKLFWIEAGWALIAIALTTLSIWLTIRIVNRRERWAKRTATAMALIVLVYPISQGPATILWSYCGEPRSWENALFVAYFPLQMADWRVPGPGKAMNEWYLGPCRSLGRRLNGNFKPPVIPPAEAPDAT